MKFRIVEPKEIFDQKYFTNLFQEHLNYLNTKDPRVIYDGFAYKLRKLEKDNIIQDYRIRNNISIEILIQNNDILIQYIISHMSNYSTVKCYPNCDYLQEPPF